MLKRHAGHRHLNYSDFTGETDPEQPRTFPKVTEAAASLEHQSSGPSPPACAPHPAALGSPPSLHSTRKWGGENVNKDTVCLLVLTEVSPFSTLGGNTRIAPRPVPHSPENKSPITMG